MSALDRALIRAYRQQRGGAASHRPSTAVPDVQVHPLHAAEATLAGPHFRLDTAHQEEPPSSEAHVATGIWQPFRVDVGALDVPEVSTPALPEHAAPPATTTFIRRDEPHRALPTPVVRPEPVVTVVRPMAAPAPQGLSLAETPESQPTVALPGSRNRPQLVVDHFRWPEVCDAMDRALAQSGVCVRESLGLEQRRAVAMVAIDAAAGASTALLAVARRLAAEGARVTILDANFRRPALAELLSVNATHGWDSAVDGKAALADVLIESLEDHIVLVPLATPRHAGWLDAHATAKNTLWQPLRDLSDVVLIDAGPLDATHPAASLQSLSKVAPLDGVFLVCDRRTTTPQEVVGLTHVLHATDVPVLGTIENFSPKATGT